MGAVNSDREQNNVKFTAVKKFGSRRIAETAELVAATFL